MITSVTMGIEAGVAYVTDHGKYSFKMCMMKKNLCMYFKMFFSKIDLPNPIFHEHFELFLY